MVSNNSNEPKILFWDLENVQEMRHVFHPGNILKKRQAGFCSNLAYILVFGYKWLGKKPEYITPDRKDFKNIPHDIHTIDKEICRKAIEILNEADVIVTWYGDNHDFKFLTGRAAAHGLYLPHNLKHIDLFKVASRQLNLSSNRLDVVAREFGCETKTPISHALWPRCWMGDTSALSEMAEYCGQDCAVLEQVYMKLRPLIKSHPNMRSLLSEDGSRDGCPVCGSVQVVLNGRYATVSGYIYQKLLCTGCQHSYKGSRVKFGEGK